jgi:hypothetical protein
MSSVAQVQPLTRELGGLFAPNQGWKVQVSAIHRKLIDPNFEWAIRDLTWSRVKKWFFGEHSRIDFDHMVALRELKALEEAKREHQTFIAATTKMAALLAAEGASLSRAQMDALARIASRSAHVSGDYDAGSCEQFRAVAGAGNVGAIA